MDSTLTVDCVPKRLCYSLGSLEPQPTREIESGNSDLCTMHRPPPTGEDSTENVRSKEGLTGPTKGESYDCPSPRLTPRRCTAKELPASCGVSHTSEEDKLAPLGFEPEGEAVSTPTFREPSGSCFTDMLNDSEGSYVFYQYLRRVNCDILMDFCRACDDFRGMVPTSPQTLATAKAILQQYILTRETCDDLGIKASTRAKIAELVCVQPIDPLLFEEAYSEVVANMKNIHYKTFLNSSFFKEFAETQNESPKLVSDLQASYNRRFQGGYLPTLPEEKVLGFSDEMEEFEFEQQCKSAKVLSHSGGNSTSDEKNARKLLHVPIKDVNSPYYYPAAPLASITESESQSISSDALTDDTLSMTTDTSDGHSRCSGRRAHRSRNNAIQSRFPFVPRTHRMPKEARHPIGPDEFAKILTEKLEKVLAERQLKEREALNLSQSLDDERPCSSQSKKSILQEAIDNKERRDRIPLSTMVQLPLQDGDTSSISTSNHSSSKSTGARATAGSGVQNSSSSESTHRKYRGARHAWKSSKNDSESVNKPNEQLAPNTFKEPKITKDTSIANDEIPFLTLNNHRIQEWMATGEEELKKQKSKPHQSKSSRQPSNSRMDSYGGHHQPKQPIAQDPLMPLLHGPEPTTVLGEVRRRLMATKEHDRKSKHNQRHRSRNSVEDTSDQSSYYGKESSTDLSSCSQSLLSYDLNQHQSYSSIPSSASNIANDTKSRSDSGIGGGVRKKEKHNATTVIYWLWGEPIAYRTSLPGKRITLEQFKTQLIPRKGEFRYFFKTKTDDHDCEVVYEEVREDEMALPMFEEKIVGKVEKVD